VIDDTLAAAPGGNFQFEGETVRILSLGPATGYTNIELQLSRFDAQWVSSINFSATDSLQQGLQSFQNGSSTGFASSFVKALPTGGTANISFLTDYRLLSSPPTGSFGVLNPSYTSRLVFGFDHPLWRDYGVDINQMLERQPSSSAFSPIPGVHQGAVAGRRAGLTQFVANDGILVARIKYDQRKAEFERHINALVLNAEVAYWRQLQAQGTLASSTLVLDIALKLWAQSLQRLNVGAIAPPEFYQVDGLVHELRVQRETALADVLEAERNLRRIVGLPLEDGTRLVLVTPPAKAQYQPNYQAAVNDALVLRPELTLAREELRIAHIKMLLSKNLLKPDLHLAAQYSPVGFGTRLDGDGVFTDEAGKDHPSNAFRSLASTHFNDWSIGLILNVPLGYRAEMANIRQARLNLAQQYYVLKENEDRAKSYVTQQYQQIAKWYSLIEKQIARRKAFKNSVDKQIESITAGRSKLDLNIVDAIRRFAEAINGEYDAISEYNIALARFEWGKGTILHNNNVYLSEGPLPACAQVRAVDHENRRTKARVLRDPPRPLATCEDDHRAGAVLDSVHDIPGAEMLRALEPTPGAPAPNYLPRSPEALPPPPIKIPQGVPPLGSQSFSPSFGSPSFSPSFGPPAQAPRAAPPAGKPVEVRREPVTKGPVIIETPATATTGYVVIDTPETTAPRTALPPTPRAVEVRRETTPAMPVIRDVPAPSPGTLKSPPIVVPSPTSSASTTTAPGQLVAPPVVNVPPPPPEIVLPPLPRP
jgi:outer membrane protein TolC